MRPIGNGGRPTRQTREQEGSEKPGEGIYTTRGFEPHPEEYNAAKRALRRNEMTRQNIRRR